MTITTTTTTPTTATPTPTPMTPGISPNRTPVYSSARQWGLIARLRLLFERRELIWELTSRNLKIRYRRSIFGFLWAVVNPLANALVYAFVFQVLLHSPIERFVLFIVIGIVAWNAFAQSVLESMYIITGSASLVTRVRFPHEVLPISVVLTNTINFLFAMPSVFLIMLVTHAHFKGEIAYFPVLLVSTFCFALGISFISSAVAVFFQDTRNFIDIVMNLWFFLTPIIYRMKDVVSPDLQQYVYYANPMASVIESYRLMFYDNAPPDPLFILRTLASCVLTMVIGWLIFAKLSPRFVEEM